MREIKFRGKTKKTNKWIFGQLIKNSANNEFTILEDSIRYIDGYGWLSEVPYKIQQDTIGQFTNCYDWAGTPIYEGDIVEWNENVAEGQWRTIRVKVQFFDGGFYPLFDSIIDDNKIPFMRVIGNIYENKELLED